jgi:hypothetical protein
MFIFVDSTEISFKRILLGASSFVVLSNSVQLFLIVHK